MPFHEARWWHREEGGIRCDLCPHSCFIAKEKVGVCRARFHGKDGILYSLNWGVVSSFGIDPIEKKPLFHWKPGVSILSYGSFGCNLCCPFCQNWEISHPEEEFPLIPSATPEKILEAAKKTGLPVAFTYNEPFVSFEFVYDCALLLKESSIPMVLVTNGYISDEPLHEIAPWIAAANIDVKAFSEEGYRKLGGHLAPVLNNIKTLFSLGVHIELTHLVVPGINDDLDEFKKLVAWIAGLSPMIPLHITRYFPRWQWTREATPLNLLYERDREARERLCYVYLGNVPEPANTRCRQCGKAIVIRSQMKTIKTFLTPQGFCDFCGADNGIKI